MSLDVSPDGRTIVFDLLGSLYTLPITGGKARPLTFGAEFAAQPRFSPDGKQVVFITDRSGVPNLWLVGRDGRNPRRLSDVRNTAYDTPLSSPEWSPDGSTIVVAQRLSATGHVSSANIAEIVGGEQWLLAAYDVRSGRMRWVSDTAASARQMTLGPAFSADGKTIYAAMILTETAASFSSGRDWGIGRIDLGTGTTVMETAPNIGRLAVRPAMSPNGRYLAYASTSGTRLGLRIRDLRTTTERWLIPEKLDANPRPSRDFRDIVPGYAFTPDSKAVIIAFDGKMHRVDVVTGRSSLIPFVVDVERGLGPLIVHQFGLPDTAFRTRSIMQPALSPNGNRVAFSALNRVWVMDLPLDDSRIRRPQRLTGDSVGEFYPSWSPDGRWVAYSTWKDGEGGALCKALAEPSDSSSTCQRLTTDSALYFHTAFTPDGKRVVVVRATAPPARVLTHNTSGLDPLKAVSVVWVPANGGPPTRLAGVSTSAILRPRLPVEQIYFTDDTTRLFMGLSSFTWGDTGWRTELIVADSVTNVMPLNDISGVFAPNGRRALLTHAWVVSEVSLPTRQSTGSDTLNVEEAQRRPFGSMLGAANRWGSALAPWISWSRDGNRVLFSQGGTLFLGDIRPGEWTSFRRVDVPLMVPVDIPRGTLALRGARIITMHGGRVIERGVLVVRDNRILAVGSLASIKIPAGAHVLDVPGKTILPGYIDIHDHLPLPYGVHAQQCWQCFPRLAYGVTALRDPYARQDIYSEVFAFSERERAGLLVAPRIFSTGIPHLRSDRPILTLDDARAIVRPTADYFGAETFKEYDGRATRRARQLVAQAAAEAGLNATIEGPPRQVTAFVDGYSGVEHAFAFPVYDDILSLVAKSGTTHTQTFGVIADGIAYMLRSPGAPWNEERMRRFVPPSEREAYGARTVYLSYFGQPELTRLRRVLKSAAGIVKRGGRVGMGGHGSMGGVGFHYEMWLHALGGMPNHEILRSATIVGATAIGHANDLGSLEVGKLADLQILDKNPLEDIHNTTSIRYVMKNGRLYQADDLTEIWPRHKPLSTIYVQDTTLSSPAAAQH